jgi:hypothetical protein
MNEDDADADEEVEEDEEWGDMDEDGGAEVSFVAKRASAFCVVENCCCLTHLHSF